MLERYTARALALPLRIKLIASAALVATLALAFGASFATRDRRVSLFATPLRPDQLSDVETRLAAWRIAYAPLPDNVRVDGAKRAEILLKLAIAGVPQRHLATSAEAFAHVGALTPQSVLDAQSRDALADELAQGLRGLDGVADARVVIAPARGGVYADDPQRDASASVRVTLAPGARLTPGVIDGIRAFVAGGVPGLDAARVAVVDDRGTVDPRGGTERDASALQTDLQSALDAAYGAGVTIVRVHREAVGERRETHDTRNAALPGALVRTTGDERYASDRKRYAKQHASEEHGSETHDVRRTLDPDATARLSVAVIVDAAQALDIAKIRALAEAATGIDHARGDTVTVEAVHFASAALPRTARVDGWTIAGLFAGFIPQAIVGVVIVMIVSLAAKPAFALITRSVEAAGVRAAIAGTSGVPPVRVRGALMGEPPHVAAAVISALPAATATAVLELYPPEERAQIVRRLARASNDYVPSVEEVLRAHG